jgi:GT2 family glycosyltransferase
MKDSLPLVSIVILNWNGLKDTIECLESVKLLSYSNFEVIVVDNGSEGSLAELEDYKNITFVKNPKNLGFAGGQNSALPYCNGEYILLLNNDATIHPDSIHKALETFSQDEKIAVVGGKSYSVDEDGESTHGFYSFQKIDPVTADVHTYNKDSQVASKTITVSGSAVMIKRAVIDTVGYFDNRFFAYYEETDLFARYLRAGYKIYYNPELIIWHKDGASTRNKRFMYYYLMLKNQFLFAYKNFDQPHLRMFKKTYFRNFRRSLWVYIKDRSSTEAIHKARVRSTVWNILHLIPTALGRIKNIKINRDFNYSKLLVTQQPISASLIINGVNAKAKDILAIIDAIVKSSHVPGEIVVVTTKKIMLPKYSPFISIRNIVHKNLFNLTYREYGFMSSNTNSLIYSDAKDLLNCNIEEFTLGILKAVELQAQNESVIVLNKEASTQGNDLALTNGGTASLFSIRKSDLTNFLVVDDSIKDLSNESLGKFINWCVMECMPVSRIELSVTLQDNSIKTSHSNFPILSSSLRWYLKKSLRALHLSRVFAKVRKIIKSRNTTEIIPETIEKSFEYIKDEIKNTPILINTRDRVDPLKIQLNWLENSGFKRIAIIDNDSTYSELINLFETTNYQVIPLGRNGMHRAPWESFAVRFIANNLPYIVTDPDILPATDTPSTTINKLFEVLHKYPNYDKAGVALKIDDIPDIYQMKSSVIDWESRFWDDSLKLEKDIYAADVDTTLALYKPNTWWFLSPSIRVGGKYAMQHEPWYQDLENPTNDMMYYRARASSEVSTWTKGKLPKHHLRALKKEGLL